MDRHLAREGGQDFAQPGCFAFAQFAEAACEEVVGAFDEDELLGLGQGIHQRFQLRARAEWIAGAADKELGLGAGLQEIKIVSAVVHRGDRSAEADQGLHPMVRGGGAQADSGAEGKPSKNEWPLKLGVQPVECGADVIHFAGTVAVLAFT